MIMPPFHRHPQPIW